MTRTSAPPTDAEVAHSDHELRASLLRHLPLILLAITSLIALVSGPTTGWTEPARRLEAQLAVLALTAALIGWWSRTRSTSRPGPVAIAYYVVRTLLALTLTLLNPLFCIFAWIGFIDADDYLPPRWIRVGIGATAVTMALGQSGGLPWSGPSQAALFAVLLVVNFGLAITMGHYARQTERTSAERAAAITELEQVNAELERAMAENAALHEQLVAQAREGGVREERQRLAREIHDTIAQSLAGILAQLQAVEPEGDPGETRRRLGRATGLAREALADARRSVMDLAPAPLGDDSLATAVCDLVARWGAEHPGVRTDAVVTGESRPLHPEVEATVLRVTQESLTNIAKHARATRLGVTLAYDEAEVILDVRDDGLGFDPGQAAPPTSFGLRGMRQRAERLAGVLDVESGDGAGTAISMRLPALGRGAA